MHTYICEVCDKTETLTQEQAYQAGWDYPPFIGHWGVLSPRTCPDCPMTETVWWAIIQQGQGSSEEDAVPLTEKQLEVVVRIQAETLDMELKDMSS